MASYFHAKFRKVSPAFKPVIQDEKIVKNQQYKA